MKKTTKAPQGSNVSARRQAPPVVGEDWREFTPLELLPSLEGAMAVFPQKGYHGATVRDLASAAGITVPTLYYYHGDKQNILIDLLSLGFGELLERTQRARASVPGDPLSQFECMIEVAVLHMTRRFDLAILESEIRYLEPDNRTAYIKLRADFAGQLREIVERGVSEGVFALDHLGDSCRAILGMIQAITIWYRPDGEESPPEIAAHYVEMSRRIVGAAAG